MDENELLWEKVTFVNYCGDDRENNDGVNKVGTIISFPNYMREEGPLAKVLCIDGEYLVPIKFLTILT